MCRHVRVRQARQYCHRIRESQNVTGWQGPLWVTQSLPLPKQGHPEQAAQHRVQAGLEYLQRRRPQPLWAACSSVPECLSLGLHNLLQAAPHPRSLCFALNRFTSCVSLSAGCVSPTSVRERLGYSMLC